MAVRLRPVQFVINAAVMADDGDTLTPLHLESIVIPASELEGFAAQFTQQLAAREAELNEAT